MAKKYSKQYTGYSRELNKNRVNLVTGGAGFLGSHLIDSLMTSGEKVICIDNFSNGNLNNIERWLDNKNFIFEKFDVCNKYKTDIDRIWHLASLASPKKYLENPISTINSSFIGSYNLLELARNSGARILFSSSSEIYGDSIVSPIYEENYGNVNCFSERACYSEGKRMAETLFFQYKHQYKVDVRIARIFNTYGPRLSSDDGRVIPNFINQIIEEKPIRIYGSGLQTRSFCYVSDMVIALRALMESDYKNPINLGFDKEISINDLAKLISSKLDKPLKIEKHRKLNGDPMYRRPSIEKAKKELKWSPKVTLVEGLDVLINHILRNKKMLS